MNIDKLNDVCDVCDALCDCVRCNTKSSTYYENDENRIDTGTISKTTSSQYNRLASKHTEINILTKSKPVISYEDNIARTTEKEYQNNTSQNSTTNHETIIHQDFNKNYSSSTESDVYINSIVDCRAVARYFNNVVKVSFL